MNTGQILVSSLLLGSTACLALPMDDPVGHNRAHFGMRESPSVCEANSVLNSRIEFGAGIFFRLFLVPNPNTSVLRRYVYCAESVRLTALPRMRLGSPLSGRGSRQTARHM